MKKAFGIIAIVAALAVAPIAAIGRTKPNIVFILTDDLGFGDVGFTCNERTNVLARLRTPCLDRLASEGVVLTAHYAAAPVSAPSRASLITGRIQGCCSLATTASTGRSPRRTRSRPSCTARATRHGPSASGASRAAANRESPSPRILRLSALASLGLVASLWVAPTHKGRLRVKD